MRTKSDGKTKNKTMIISCAILILAVLGGAAFVLISKYLPNSTVISFYNYNANLNRDKNHIVFNDVLIEKTHYPIIKDGEIYLPVSFVSEYIDKYLFWESSSNRLTITTENKVIKMRTDNLDYFINDKPFTLSLPVYKMENDAYMPQSFLEEFYNIKIENSMNEYNIITVDNTLETKTAIVLSKKTALRYEPNIKSPVEIYLNSGDAVMLFETVDAFTKIRIKGLIGYVKTADLSDFVVSYNEKSEKSAPTAPVFNKKFNLVWDQMGTVEANSNENRRIVHDGLDVICPTWFSFNADVLDGEIINIADIDYVNWAHEQGYQVWALITDNFNTKVSHAILSDANIREYVIKQLLSFVSMYKLDGINIDFEQVPKEDGIYFIQFLRELYPMLKEQGGALSVDMYVPMEHTLHYNRTEVAKTADYIIIMGYDEHYATSPISGSVASLAFVEQGIVRTLDEADKNKVVLGMPYYNRVWREVTDSDGFVNVTSKAYSMSYTYEMFMEKKVAFEWNEISGNYYAEYEEEEDGEIATYKVWLEDARSIEEKLKLAAKYDLAGVAGWKRNLETDDIWALISKYNK